MRQNLTNIAAKDLESLEHFYIVGSTTKEGLLDESTNVKIDLKKELAEAGGGEGGGQFNIDDIILADDLLEKCEALNLSENTSAVTDWTFSDICIQDSNGLLQQAFEEARIEDGTVTEGVCIMDKNKSLTKNDITGAQEIYLYEDSIGFPYYIGYDTDAGKYCVRKEGLG